jgi:phosphoglycerate dehydrogenase-like enzyme
MAGTKGFMVTWGVESAFKTFPVPRENLPMARRPVILSLTKMHEAGIRLLREAGELRMASATDPATLQREVIGADGLIIRTGGVVDAALLDRGRDLKVVGRHGVGYDQIDVEAATERGVQVVYTPGANTESVAEHVLAMMIGLSKHFPQMSDALAAGDYHFRTALTGRDLLGRSLGIIGFGRIGRRMGELAYQAFRMKVLYHDIVPAPPEIEARAGARRVSFEEVLETCEYITLHVPLDASTRAMIDRAALARMRDGAVLINACRGPVVVEAAVAEALGAGRLFGYGGDVFEDEPPPPDHPLIGRKDCNLILTPHSAAQTEESLRNMAEWVALDVLGVLNGEPPRNPVNDPSLVQRNRKQKSATARAERQAAE